MGCVYYCNWDYSNVCGWDRQLSFAYVRRMWKRRSNRIKGTLGIANDRARQFTELVDHLIRVAPQLEQHKRELYRIIKTRLVAISAAAVSSMLKEKANAAYILEASQKYARECFGMLEHMAEDTDAPSPTSISTDQ